MFVELRQAIKDDTATNLRDAALELRRIQRQLFFAFTWPDDLKQLLKNIEVAAGNLEIMADCFEFEGNE